MYFCDLGPMYNMFLNNHNNLSWSPIHQIVSLSVERDEELVTWLMERIAPERLTPHHVLQFLNSTSLKLSSLSDSPETTVSTPQGVPDWYVQQFKQLAAGIPYQVCYGRYTFWPLSERPNVPYPTNVWFIQTFSPFFRNEPSPCTLRFLCPRSAHGSAAMSPSPCRVQRQKEMTSHCEGTFLQTALFPPVTGMIYDYHNTLMCRIHRGPGNLEIWGWAWNTCKVLPFSHAVFPVFLLISSLLSLISLLPVVLHFSETPIRILTHVLPPTGYVLTHLL